MTAGEKAKVCRSLARYPLDCSPDMAEAVVYHPTNHQPNVGDSVCLVRHQKRLVVCTSRSGVWECTQAIHER